MHSECIQSVKNSSTYYKIENGILFLRDAELGLDIEEPFTLPSISTSSRSTHIHAQGKEVWLEKEGLRHGQWQSYAESGSLLSECFYLEGLLHGPSHFYNEAQVLLSLSWFYRGLRHGKMHQYYQTGALYSVQSFVNGLRVGDQLYYYPDGSMRTKMSYVLGFIDGEMLLFWPNGQCKRSLLHRKGQKCGVERFYSEEGTLLEEVTHAS